MGVASRKASHKARQKQIDLLSKPGYNNLSYNLKLRSYNMMVPMVVEKTSSSERAYDVFSLILKERGIFIYGEINDALCSSVVAQLLYLEAQDPTKDINLYINSQGGSVLSGLTVVNCLKILKAPVASFVLGQAASMGSIIASAATKGKRYMLPYSRAMLHQVSSGSQGTYLDMKIALAETERLNELLTNMYVDFTGQPYEKLKEDMSRDFFLTPEEAVAYGLADHVMTERMSSI